MREHAIQLLANGDVGHGLALWRPETAAPGEFELLEHRFCVGNDERGTAYVKRQFPQTLLAAEGDGGIERARVVDDPSERARLSLFNASEVHEAETNTTWKEPSLRALFPTRVKFLHLSTLLWSTILCRVQGNPAALARQSALPGADRLGNTLVQDGGGERLLDSQGESV